LCVGRIEVVEEIAANSRLPWVEDKYKKVDVERLMKGPSESP